MKSIDRLREIKQTTEMRIILFSIIINLAPYITVHVLVEGVMSSLVMTLATAIIVVSVVLDFHYRDGMIFKYGVYYRILAWIALLPTKLTGGLLLRADRRKVSCLKAKILAKEQEQEK